MQLEAQWAEIEAELAAGWADARLRLTLTDESRYERATALLGPLTPGRSGRALRFSCARAGAGPAPEAVRRALARLDVERIAGRLELLSAAALPAAAPEPRPSLAEAWDAELAVLPADWSDLYAQLDLPSSDYLDPAALLLAPLNPARYGEQPGFRFRSARRFGYGAAPSMVRRCLARLDDAGIDGELRVLRALSDTRPVATQGPVWYLGGKVV